MYKNKFKPSLTVGILNSVKETKISGIKKYANKILGSQTKIS